MGARVKQRCSHREIGTFGWTLLLPKEQKGADTQTYSRPLCWGVHTLVGRQSRERECEVHCNLWSNSCRWEENVFNVAFLLLDFSSAFCRCFFTLFVVLVSGVWIVNLAGRVKLPFSMVQREMTILSGKVHLSMLSSAFMSLCVFKKWWQWLEVTCKVLLLLCGVSSCMY